MIAKEDIKGWGEAVVAVFAAIALVWHSFKISSLSAKWDGFKVEYDKLNRSDAKREGELERIDHTQSQKQIEQQRQEDREDRNR